MHSSSEFDKAATSSARAGFSLIELMVAVLLTGILMAGIMRVYAASLAGFNRTNELIGSQRQGRWAVDLLSEDVASIGYFAFVPARNPLAIFNGQTLSSGLQEPFMIIPGDPSVSATRVTVRGPDPNNPTALINQDLYPDSLQFFSDIPLPVSGRLSADVPNESTTFSINFTTGSDSDVQLNDVAAILDNPLDVPTILQKVSAGTYALNPSSGPVDDLESQAAQNSLTQATVASSNGGNLRYHRAGTRVMFFRSNMVTRYYIKAKAWDPSNSTITVPCLMRQQAPYPSDLSLIDWSAQPDGELIAENIEGFRVDMSLDGGTTWLRGSNTAWGDNAAGIVKDTNAKLVNMGLAASSSNTLQTGAPDQVLWFRKFPLLVRIDITSRTNQLRAENSTSPSKLTDFGRRTQTMMIAPRNFGLPIRE